MKSTTVISRILWIIILCILLFIYASCQPSTNKDDTIYRGTGWVIKELNDTTLICIPNNSNQINKPYIINIKNFNQDNQYEGI